MAAKITLAWVSLKKTTIHPLSQVQSHSVSLTSMVCMCRGPLQCWEEKSGELLHHANLQVNTERLGRMLTLTSHSELRGAVYSMSISNRTSAQTSVSSTRFRMKCHLCVNYIEMQTDPATCDYVIVSGASRKEERWDMAENEQILTTGKVFMCVISQKINSLLCSLLFW